MKAIPTNPRPRRPKVAGSGTDDIKLKLVLPAPLWEMTATCVRLKGPEVSTNVLFDPENAPPVYGPNVRIGELLNNVVKLTVPPVTPPTLVVNPLVGPAPGTNKLSSERVMVKSPPAVDVAFRDDKSSDDGSPMPNWDRPAVKLKIQAPMAPTKVTEPVPAVSVTVFVVVPSLKVKIKLAWAGKAAALTADKTKTDLNKFLRFMLLLPKYN